jgi:hypothetical protein
MLKPDSYITKDGNTFYIELEEYNQKSDFPIEDGDTIKFTYEGVKYMGNIVCVGSKIKSYIIEILKKY